MLLDTKGPEVRSGLLSTDKSLRLTKGQKLELSTFKLMNSDKL